MALLRRISIITFSLKSYNSTPINLNASVPPTKGRLGGKRWDPPSSPTRRSQHGHPCWAAAENGCRRERVPPRPRVPVYKPRESLALAGLWFATLGCVADARVSIHFSRRTFCYDAAVLFNCEFIQVCLPCQSLPGQKCWMPRLIGAVCGRGGVFCAFLARLSRSTLGLSPYEAPRDDELWVSKWWQCRRTARSFSGDTTDRCGVCVSVVFLWTFLLSVSS